MVVLGRSSQAVSHVWVGGRLIVAERKILTVDADKLLQLMRDASHYHRLDEGAWLQELEPAYRRAFSLDSHK
jgi:hypothetical protein